MRRVLALVVVASLTFTVSAQVDNVPRDVIEQRIEAAAEQVGGDADVDLTALFQILTDHYQDPIDLNSACLLYTSPSPRDRTRSRMPSSA